MKKFHFTVLAALLAIGVSAQDLHNETVATTIVDGIEQTLSPNEARKGRGFSTNVCFVPKGQWIFGGTASYSTHTNRDYKLLVVDNINSDGYTVNVSPMLAYAIGKNMAVGVRFGYGRTLLALDNASVSVAGNDFNIDYFHRLNHSYTGTIFWRPYIPLGYSNRFAVFAEVQLSMEGGQSRVVAENGVIDGLQSYVGTYSKTIGAAAALQPGVVAFITNNTALELSIGVFGISLDRVKQLKNQVESGSINSSGMNFKLNFLSIGFGVSFYL